MSSESLASFQSASGQAGLDLATTTLNDTDYSEAFQSLYQLRLIEEAKHLAIGSALDIRGARLGILKFWLCVLVEQIRDGRLKLGEERRKRKREVMWEESDGSRVRR
ncbi:hypothetical protein BJ508DRAFT_313070 [Ascobolus immersus RN42]|uniref:Uncharacterized protein n=1 Tax=Ascobolus immersus RN42 TaxID=1160509 RepID=A0A3N4HMU6_ASCIM|nr:hypothetical protein BJ508DRAFT_313070 [Ascobolus immersus RN42]